MATDHFTTSRKFRLTYQAFKNVVFSRQEELSTTMSNNLTVLFTTVRNTSILSSSANTTDEKSNSTTAGVIGVKKFQKFRRSIIQRQSATKSEACASQTVRNKIPSLETISLYSPVVKTKLFSDKRNKSYY